jgi:SpoIID/LytB domain protein
MASTAPFPIYNGHYQMEREPIVRIGIVLEEDEKLSLQFRVPATGCSVKVDAGADQELAVGETFEVRIVGGKLTLLGASGHALAAGATMIRLEATPPKRPLQAGDGVLVHGIVAGRGFHWAKEIDQTLTHVLEFLPKNGRLVMVNEIPLETYLVGVITGEMGSDCPIEFMKAQAVAARSWLLGQPVAPHPDEPFLWCNDDHCQRYQGTGGWSPRAVQAIAECRGEVLITATNRYCDARYSKSTGGISEDAHSVWGMPIEGLVAIPDAPKGSAVERFFPITEANLDEYLNGEWLKGTDCFASPNVVAESTITQYLGRVDEIGEYFRWDLKLTQEMLCQSLTKRGGIADLSEVLDLIPGARGRSGRLESLVVRYRSTDGTTKDHTILREYYIRAGLSMKFLYSSCFTIRAERDSNGKLVAAHLRGAGWGHGAGLCQIGALGRALKGQSYAESLMHYYTDTKLEKIYR